MVNLIEVMMIRRIEDNVTIDSSIVIPVQTGSIHEAVHYACSELPGWMPWATRISTIETSGADTGTSTDSGNSNGHEYN